MPDLRGLERAALTKAIPPALRELALTLRRNGFRSWAVGGSVRDIIYQTMRGLPVAFRGDWDVATDARPEQVKSAFRKVIPTGIAHGTVTVLLGGESIEVTTLRGEKGHTDGRRPDEVYFVHDLTEDLARRDFTINAMAFDLDTSELMDPFSGRLDLERQLIRAVGDANQRYTEDGLRPLRAARFAAQLEMELEVETRAAIRPTLERFRLVSKERVQGEWLKALKAPKASRCFRIQLEEGLLEATLPGLFLDASDSKIAQAFTRLDAASPDPIRRLTHVLSAGHEPSFPSPEERAQKAELDAAVLRAANKDQARIGRLIRSEQLPNAEPPELRRYLARVGREHAADVLIYQRERGTPEELLGFLQKELESGAPLSTKELAVTGRDLLEAGLVAGPIMREALGALLELVLDDPGQNVRDVLVAKVFERLPAPSPARSFD